MLCKHHLLLTGHIVQTTDEGVIKKYSISSLIQVGDLAVARKKATYKGNMKASMKNCSIDLKNWENMAADRSAWHTLVSIGMANMEQTRNKESTVDEP